MWTIAVLAEYKSGLKTLYTTTTKNPFPAGLELARMFFFRLKLDSAL